MADILGVFPGGSAIAFILLQAAPVAPTPMVRIPAVQGPVMPSGTIPAEATAVVGHVQEIFKGNIKGSLRFVADDVENSISDLKTSIPFPAGRTTTHAMYLAMTDKGKLGVSNMGCAPEGEAVRCEFIFGAGPSSRHFIVRYYANGGPITRSLSYENHEGKKR